MNIFRHLLRLCLLLLACGGAMAQTITVYNGGGKIEVGAQRQLTAYVPLTPNTVTWSVNGIPGGNATVGTVSANGLYVAPAAVPANNVVSVRATSTAFPAKFDDTSFTVRSVESKPYSRSPYAPFRTTTMQQEASRKLGYSASRTMSVAQRLYENGYITYMRTDSTTLSETAIAAARDQARELYGAEYLPDAPRTYANKVKNAQEPHEAIRSLDGRVWRKVVTKEELAELQGRLTVLSTRLVGGRPVIQVLADAAPDAGFERIGPDLEDVYFGELRRAAAPVPHAA